MDLLEMMQNRRSVRKYTAEKIDEEKITKIVQAGLLSPTGHGYRPWHLVVVTDKAILLELAKCRASAKMLEGAQAAIAVLGDESISDTWVEDCSSVMTNMHLMADSLGVGSCWIQGRLRMKDDNQTTEEYVRDILKFPKPLRLEAILSLGMPDGHPDRHELDGLLMEKVHYNTFKRLLNESISVGGLTLSNRLVMPPMATRKADDGNNVPQEIFDYYCDRAKHSKIGLIITEHSYINIQGKAHPGQMSIADDKCIESFRALTEGIHNEGVKVVAQINHAGSATKSEVTNQPIVGPSAVFHHRRQDEIPVEMTVQQIQEVTKWFAEAAVRAKKAGFDGVEIHSAHGYLLNQFYSPFTNKRTDEYGCQSVENRTRFHQEVIKAVRQAVGDDFMVVIRLGGCDYEEGGSTIEDCVEACKIFEKCGVDLIDLSGGMNSYVRADHPEPGYFKDMTSAVKKVVNVPIILTGGVTTPAEAEKLLEEGCADLIGVGRAIYKDAHWAD